MAYFSDISYRDGRQSTESEAVEKLSSEEKLIGGGDEFHGDGSSGNEKSDHDRALTTHPVGNLTATKRSNNRTIGPNRVSISAPSVLWLTAC